MNLSVLRLYTDKLSPLRTNRPCDSYLVQGIKGESFELGWVVRLLKSFKHKH